MTLGCAKNEVDSEEIAGVLSGAGYEVDGSKKADVTVINTCGFLDAARRESIDAIRKAVAEKGGGKVIVAGCLAQRMGDELAKVAPGADAYVGVGQMGQFDRIVNNVGRTSLVSIEPPHHHYARVGVRARPGREWSAYLKVSEGCDHRCTFCTIPSFRGNHASKPIERIVEEARHLVESGTKEINLVAQDVTQYGYDLYREFTLPKLLRTLNGIDGLEWIRILYFYPNRLTDDVIAAMRDCERVVPYIDIPLQHAHPDVLRRMKRPWDGDRYRAVFDKVRDQIPSVAIRTTFIVGFPGETEEEFDYLVDFVKKAELDRVGAFTYSRESGTPAHDMPGQVPFRTKQTRYDRLMRTQKPIALAKNLSWVGKELTVLVEDQKSGYSVGRSFRDAPEIDGLVWVKGDHTPGTFVTAKIEQAQEHDLIGTAV